MNQRLVEPEFWILICSWDLPPVCQKIRWTHQQIQEEGVIVGSDFYLPKHILQVGWGYPDTFF